MRSSRWRPSSFGTWSSCACDKLGFCSREAYPPIIRCPPESLGITVAIFGTLIYALSYIPLVRKMTHIADPYFESREPTRARIWPFSPFAVSQGRLATMMLIFLIVINQAQVGMDVRLSFYSRDLYNALQAKDQGAFWGQIIFVFLPWASALVASLVIEFFVTSTLVIRWRRWLSARYIGRWLYEGVHYKMALTAAPTDNPDQRISEDIYGYIYGGGSGTGIYGYSVLVLQTLTTARLLRDRALGAIGELHDSGHRDDHPGIPVLDSADLRRHRHGGDASHRAAAGAAVLRPAALRSRFPLRPRARARI